MELARAARARRNIRRVPFRSVPLLERTALDVDDGWKYSFSKCHWKLESAEEINSTREFPRDFTVFEYFRHLPTDVSHRAEYFIVFHGAPMII